MVEPHVRQPVRTLAIAGRRLEDRAAASFPRLAMGFSRAVLSLPLRSRLRMRILVRFLEGATAAVNRGDYAAGFVLLGPGFVMEAPEETFYLSDFPRRLSGREERVRLERRWRDEWAELRYEPAEVITSRDQLLVIGNMHGTGLASGAVVDSEWADLFTFRGGWIVREQLFFDHAAALDAAGLPALATGG